MDKHAIGDHVLGFVVRTKNEAMWVGHAIQSIIDHCGRRTQIVVVDDGSTDDTLDVVNLFNARHFDIEVMRMSQGCYTPGRALNAGIARVRGDVIGILSAHCVVTKLDCDAVFEQFDDVDVFGVMGIQIPIYRGKKISRRYVWSNFVDHEDDVIVNPLENIAHERRYFFHNAFSFVSRRWWERRMFPEDLSGKEDRYWAGSLIDDMGGKFVLDKSLECQHHWTPNGATWSGMG